MNFNAPQLCCGVIYYEKTLDKNFHYGRIAIRKGCPSSFGRYKLESSELAEIIINEIYPRFYFLLPRLPAASSPSKISERLFSIMLLLEVKSKQGKALTIGEIGEICKLSPSVTTRKIQDLSKRGLVTKVNLKHDDRSKEISLTPEGIQTLFAEKELRKRWFEKILEPLEEKERNFVINTLLKMSKIEL